MKSVQSVALFIAWLLRFFSPTRWLTSNCHLAGFLVGVDDDVIAVQDFAVENLQRQRILHQLLDRALQRTRAEVRVVALREQKIFGCVRQLERNLAIGEQAANVFQAQLDDLAPAAPCRAGGRR